MNPTDSTTNPTTLYLQVCLDRLRVGDTAARQELFTLAGERLARLTRKMFHSSPRLRPFEQTADVFQNSMLRLHRALGLRAPATVLDFYRLAALQIRRELIDLARHYFGPTGMARHVRADDETITFDPDRVDPTQDPERLAAWIDFHERVATLPDDQRTAFDLLYYQGLTHAEAAEILGVCVKTVQRLWRDGRINLHARLHGDMPPL